MPAETRVNVIITSYLYSKLQNFAPNHPARRYTEELALRVKKRGLDVTVGGEKLCMLMYADDIIM